MRPALGLLCLWVAGACAPQAPPPLGQALIIIDTDLAVPSLTNRLRVDLYTADAARWYESREIGRVEPSNWPVSFSVYDPDPDASRIVLVRLRTFPDGLVRDYRGERYAPRPAGGNPSDLAPIPPPPGGETPRLLDAQGADHTPASEPAPLVTVDRLLLVRVEPGRRGSVRVVLRGRCAGTMANLAQRKTCIDQENVLVPLAETVLDPEMIPATSVQGTFAPTVPCNAEVRPPATAADGIPLFDEEVCVPGGAFLFGNADTERRDAYSDAPLRLAVLPPFRMDKYEVTVGRWRAALASGFVSPDNSPVANESPLALAGSKQCTWSVSLQKRETFPVTCLTRDAARAFCKFLGGDLPTEAQSEYVAEDVGRSIKTRYPWGDETPDCERAGYGRYGSGDLLRDACIKSGGWGPQPVDRFANGDVALGTGVVGLAGNVGEIMADPFRSFHSMCWASNGLDSPQCDDPSPSTASIRGGGWAGTVGSTENGRRADMEKVSQAAGLRCVRGVP